MIRTALHKHLKLRILSHNITRYQFCQESEEKKVQPPQETADDKLSKKEAEDVYDLLKRFHTSESRSPFYVQGRRAKMIKKPRAETFFKYIERGGSLQQATKLLRSKEIPKIFEKEQEEKAKKSPISPTSVQIKFRDYLNDVKMQRQKMRDFLQKRKPGLFDRRTISLRYLREMKSINKLQPLNLFSKTEKRARYFDITLNEMFEQNKRFDAEYCWDKLQEFFSNNIYRFLKEDQFNSLIFRQPAFRKYIEKLPLKFFQTYSRMVADENLLYVIENCQDGFLAQTPVLRFAKGAKKANYFDDEEDFFLFLEQMRLLKQDLMLFQYFIFNENSTPYINYSYFIEGILNLSWGGKINEEQLNKQLNHLLFMKFKLNSNFQLQQYFADLFFGADTYDKGIMAVVLNILLLQRISHLAQISDILEAFRSTFGIERYQFYMENELPKILKQMNQKQYYLHHIRGLGFNSQAVRSIKINKLGQPYQNLTNLDEIFIKSAYIRSGSSEINYSCSHYNLLAEKNEISTLSPQYQLQDALLNNNYEFVKKKLSELIGFKSYNRAAVNYAQKKIYRSSIQRKNFLKYNTTFEMSVRQAQKRIKNAQNLRRKNQIRDYFKQITRKSLKMAQQKQPDIKLTRPPLADKFPLRIKTWMISKILQIPNLKASPKALYLLQKFKPLIKQRLQTAKGLDLTNEERLQKRNNVLKFRRLKAKFRNSKLVRLLFRRQAVISKAKRQSFVRCFSTYSEKRTFRQREFLLKQWGRLQNQKNKKQKHIHESTAEPAEKPQEPEKVEEKITFEEKKQAFLRKLRYLKFKQMRTRTPKFSFSSNNKDVLEIELAQENLKQKGDGLGRYLGITKMIDQAVQEEEKQQLFVKAQKSQAHKEVKSLNQNETQTLKQLFALDREKPQQQIFDRIQKISDRQPNDLFKKVERGHFQPPRYQKEKAQIQEQIAQSSALLQKAQEIQLDVPVPDVQLSNYELTQQAKFQIEQFFKNEKPKDQLIQEVQSFLAGIQPTPNNYHLYLISELIKNLESNIPEDSLLVFAQIICQVKDKITLDEKIRVRYSTQYGDIEKNYGKYIGQTCTPFSLGSKGYNYLLDFILKDGNYNRLVYKRIMSHYSLYETVLYDSVFTKISEITIQNKIPQTCAEIIYAFQFRKIAINTTQMRRIASLLYQFKHFESETEQLIINFYHTYQWELKFSDLKPIIQRLMSLKKRDRYMSLYESLKDQILARKLRQTPTDPVELTKVMTEFKQKQRDQLQLFVRSFATLLVENQLIEEARLVINDSKRIRYQFQVEDYNLWLYSHVNHFEDALKIFHDFENKFPGVYDAKMLSTLCFVIQQQKSVSESEDTKTMFSDIINKYILEKNLPLTTELVFDISNTYNKLKEFTNFSNFMKFILETRYPVVYSHKSLFYKVMNNADQDSIKGLIKSIIDVLFKDEVTKKKEQRTRSTDEPKQYEMGQSQKDNPLHIKELAQVLLYIYTRPNKNKKPKLVKDQDLEAVEVNLIKLKVRGSKSKNQKKKQNQQKNELYFQSLICIINKKSQTFRLISGYLLMYLVQRQQLEEVHMVQFTQEDTKLQVFYKIKLEQLVAIKVIDRKQADFDIYNQEAAIMKQLSHPNIVGFIDFVISTNNIYIITEYCNGPDLKQYMKQNTITEQTAIKIIKGIVKGLQCIIKKNFIHRDLKPANILFNNTISKIADFGFSRKVNPIMASMVGTPMYMAPQLLLKQSYTSKCDIWSLGVIYFEMLFGVTPWTATDIMDLIYKLQHCELQIPKKPKISPESLAFITGCLEKQEKNRFDWNEIFNHPLIKPRLNLQINSCLNEETNSQLSFIKTNRIYYLNRTQRDRSASNKQIEPLKSNESNDSQLGIRNQNNAFIDVAKLLKHKECQKIKRTQSKFEFQKNYPCQKANSQHNVSYLSSAKKCTNQSEKKYFKKKNSMTNLVQVITNLSDEASKKGLSDLVSLFMSQKTKILQHQVNFQVEIKKIKEVRKQLIDISIKTKLDFYLKLLKLNVIEKENEQYKFLHYNSK